MIRKWIMIDGRLNGARKICEPQIYSAGLAYQC
jgi:hypothetical protein